MQCTLHILKTRVQQAFLLHDFFFTSLIASHSQAKRKESVPTYTVRPYSGGEPRFRAVRVDQSDLGDVITRSTCHIWHKKTKLAHSIEDATLVKTPFRRPPSERLYALPERNGFTTTEFFGISYSMLPTIPACDVTICTVP